MENVRVVRFVAQNEKSSNFKLKTKWIARHREGLEKMEREKQREADREREEHERAELMRRRQHEANVSALAKGVDNPMFVYQPKSKFVGHFFLLAHSFRWDISDFCSIHFHFKWFTQDSESDESDDDSDNRMRAVKSGSETVRSATMAGAAQRSRAEILQDIVSKIAFEIDR